MTSQLSRFSHSDETVLRTASVSPPTSSAITLGRKPLDQMRAKLHAGQAWLRQASCVSSPKHSEQTSLLTNALFEVVAARSTNSSSSGSAWSASACAAPSASSDEAECSGASMSTTTLSACRCHAKLRSRRSRLQALERAIASTAHLDVGTSRLRPRRESAMRK